MESYFDTKFNADHAIFTMVITGVANTNDIIYLSTQIIYYLYNGRYSSSKIKKIWPYAEKYAISNYSVQF